MQTRDERGSGVVSSMFGAIAFLAFVLLATNVLVGLYATSVTTAVAYDAAQTVAQKGDDSTVRTSAEDGARKHLSSLHDLQFQWLEPTGRSACG